MADGITETLGAVFSGSSATVWTFGIMIIVGSISVLLLIFAFLWWYFKKRWNLRVEIKLVRSDGTVTIGEWGKGYFDAKRGVCYIRRPKQYVGSTPMPVFDIKRYLQGSDLLTVMQVGPDDFRPVLNKSYLTHVVTYVDDKTGEEKDVQESVLNIKVDTGLNRAWKSAQAMAAKKAYSLSSFFQQFQTPISIAIVLVACFAGFAMLWTKIGSCGAG